MKTALLPDGYADSQYYYTLKFLTKKNYIIVMEDSNGTVVKNVWEGDYKTTPLAQVCNSSKAFETGRA